MEQERTKKRRDNKYTAQVRSRHVHGQIRLEATLKGVPRQKVYLQPIIYVLVTLKEQLAIFFVSFY